MAYRIDINSTGTIRLIYRLDGGADVPIWGKVTKNGVDYGDVHECNPSSGLTITEDISVISGDILRIYGYRDAPNSNSAGFDNRVGYNTWICGDLQNCI